jgi:hypothetical protein
MSPPLFVNQEDRQDFAQVYQLEHLRRHGSTGRRGRIDPPTATVVSTRYLHRYAHGCCVLDGTGVARAIRTVSHRAPLHCQTANQSQPSWKEKRGTYLMLRRTGGRPNVETLHTNSEEQGIRIRARLIRIRSRSDIVLKLCNHNIRTRAPLCRRKGFKPASARWLEKIGYPA